MKWICRLAAPALALAALGSGAILAAQEVATPVPAPVAQAHPALWQVADEDTTIYLFGTIHLLPEGIAWYGGPVAQAFEKADELVTEIPEAAQSETSALLLAKGTLPPSQTLRDMMNESERATFEAALVRLELRPDTFDRYKPWFAAVVLATVPLQREGFDISHGVENQLDARNKQLKRPRMGLETLRDQLGIFDRFSPAVQKRYLFEVIGALPTIHVDVDRMVVAWARGDAAALADLLNAEEEDPAMYDALLTQRNRAWSRWLVERMKRPGKVFVAVGAGHLGGRDSVQDELARLGFKATRVQ
jgi:uncharacterized protein YbaP (TraB family)